MTNIECNDHYVGHSFIKPGITGLLFNESEKHLYRINYDEFVDFNYCPQCGEKLNKD